MLLKRISLIGALASFTLPALAAVDMKELNKEIDLALPAITRCEQVFADAQKIKVPEDHAAANHALKHNEEIAKGADTHKGEKPMPISPAAQAFHKDIEATRAAVEKCGIDYVATNSNLQKKLIPEAAAELKNIDPTKSADPTVTKIVNYSTEQQKMLASLNTLLSNRVMQHRLHDLVEKYFHTQNK
jgi:hypothetical protein